MKVRHSWCVSIYKRTNFKFSRFLESSNFASKLGVWWPWTNPWARNYSLFISYSESLEVISSTEPYQMLLWKTVAPLNSIIL